MKSLFVVTGLVLGTMGVAQADSPGGWSQFSEMTKPRQVTTATPSVQPKQTATVVDVYANSQRGGTWPFPPNANEGSNN